MSDGKSGFMPSLGIRSSLAASSKVLSRYTQAARTGSSQKSTSGTTASVASVESPGRGKSTLEPAASTAATSSPGTGTGLSAILASNQAALKARSTATTCSAFPPQIPFSSSSSSSAPSRSVPMQQRLGQGHGQGQTGTEAGTHPYSHMSSVQQEQVLLALGRGRNSSWRIPLLGDYSQLVRQAAASNELR